jgi:prevent-host-death family protein
MATKPWPVQDAKARFSELLDACVSEGPQIVTRRGEQMAVLVAMEEWRRIELITRPSLKSLLLAPVPRWDIATRERGRAKRRRPTAL